MAIVKISDLPLVDSPVEGTDLFVVVQDNVTKKAYASDIQTYVGFEEVQTATAGQTVFNLTTMTYAAGANNLMVFVDGVNQYEGSSYVETDNNTVTFTQGLHEGALVKFSTVQTQTSSVANAGAVTFLQAGTGAVPTNVQTKLRETVSVKDFGAQGDGVTDDTAAIQAAIDAANTAGGGTVTVPAGVYMIDASVYVNMKDNVSLVIETGAELKAITNALAVYSVIRATNVDNWSVVGGGKVTGERTTHTGVTGEGGECITVFGCNNFVIDGLTIQDGWGDGIYIGGNVTVNQSRSFTIQNCYLNNNRRNNISVTAGRDFTITNNRITNANGTAPEAGIDLEPNPSDAWDVEDCVVSNNIVWANAGPGITCSAIYHGNTTIADNVAHGNGGDGIASSNSQAPVVIANNLSYENTGYGIYLSGAPSFDQFNSSIIGNTVHNNKESGVFIRSNIQVCNVTNNTVFENDKHGIVLDRATGGTMYAISVLSNNVHSNSQAANDTYDNIHLVTGASTTVIQNNVLWKGQKTNKPKYGINIADSNCDNSVVMQNMLTNSGNTGPYVSSTTSVVVRNNIGYVTENAVLSPAFSIAAVTNVTVTIPHGCSYTPTTDQIQLQVVRDTATTWVPGSIQVTSIDATNVEVLVRVETAVAASTAKLAMLVLNV